MDKIVLSGIEFYAYGGVSEAERSIGQRYRVRLELQLDLQAAAQSDDLRETVHYGQVAEIVVTTARERPFQLIEAAAGRILERVFETFPVNGATILLEKVLPPIDGVVASAAVELTRSRDGASEGKG